jgi:hypothetical protein
MAGKAMQAAVTRKAHCYRLRFSLGRPTLEVSLDNQSLVDDPGIMAWDFNRPPVVPLRKFQDKFMVRSEGSGPGPNRDARNLMVRDAAIQSIRKISDLPSGLIGYRTGRNDQHNGCFSSLRQIVSERLC